MERVEGMEKVEIVKRDDIDGDGLRLPSRDSFCGFESWVRGCGPRRRKRWRESCARSIIRFVERERHASMPAIEKDQSNVPFI